MKAFTKMHGTGNDFVVVDGRSVDEDWSRLAAEVCDRHFGIGSDGLLVVLPSEVAQVRMRMFNPDGSEAEMCGNGIRVFTKWVAESGAATLQGDTLRVETKAGIRDCRAFFEGPLVRQVRVAMGTPIVDPTAIPVAVEARPPVKDLRLDLPSGEIRVTCVSMGNPHAVQFIAANPFEYPMAEVGPTVERHPLFPKGTNFHAIRVIDRGLIEVRTWERGAGLTLACGTGVCASAVAARLHGLADDAVRVRVPGGELRVEWDGEGEVYMTGPAQRVYTGELTNN
jgi:diaminopimelate epimerase